jgi:hypothetical protein
VSFRSDRLFVVLAGPRPTVVSEQEKTVGWLWIEFVWRLSSKSQGGSQEEQDNLSLTCVE